jgi:hypothetical protein
MIGVPFRVQYSRFLVNQVSRDFQHPSFIRLRRDSCDLHHPIGELITNNSSESQTTSSSKPPR